MTVIVDSGVANLASIAGAFRRLGVEPTVTADPAVVAAATRVVLPGVGAFGAGVAALSERGLDSAIRTAHARGAALLGICLGFQLMTEGSAEAPDARGLGLVPGRCERLPATVRVPQLGWNTVVAATSGRVVAESGDAAFANSYCLRIAPAQGQVAWSEHGARFVAAFEEGSLVGCQFHPELSGAWGSRVLRRWLGETVASPDERSTLPGVEANQAMRRIVPCLDVAAGRVVKGVRFQGLRDVGEPAELAARYQDQGADEIVLLDISASVDDRATALDVVRRVRRVLQIPFTAGGGVREATDAARLLAEGADKVSVNTAAVLRPDLVAEMAARFGRQAVVLAIDARRAPAAVGSKPSWQVLVRGGREVALDDALAWAEEGERRGAGELLITSWDRDGTGEGPDVELLAALRPRLGLPIVASGGLGERGAFADAFTAGADAALAASLFHDQRDTVGGVKRWLAENGFRMRAAQVQP